ncbi:hypothetical protein E4U21_003666 [Claviceps maximensis]|nr:hypothetical protein E4U21_003666 [Claviceps maximensis]
MLFKSCLAAGLAVAGAAAGTVPAQRRTVRCAAHGPTDHQTAEAKELALLEAELIQTGAPIPAAPVEVNVYFHSVSNSTKGLLSDATIKAQFDVLATDFLPAGFHMKLVNTTKTVNARWSDTSEYANELALKRGLRQGNYRDLNIYFIDRIDEQDSFGRCWLPQTFDKGSDEFYRDGCVIQSGTVPGGWQPPAFNKGKTVTHETGHFLGLFHTFEGGCSGSGDLVADTPAQESSSSGCPVNRDSCPGKPGLDPIHNFMDYSDDSCYTSFTKGQHARMHNLWTRYRAGK